MIELINWREVKARNFEKFIYHFLESEGFENRKWFGQGGGDRGRDIVATRHEKLPFNLGYNRKWIFQCKKWSRMPRNIDIVNELMTASQHKPDFWVLVIPVEPSASVIDYFNELDRNNPFNIRVILIPLVAIEEILHKRPELRHVLEKGYLPGGKEDV